MLRVHATFFGAQPNGELLREHVMPSYGFRLRRHKPSGAYLLDPYGDSDVSAFCILDARKVPAAKKIKADLYIEEKAGRLDWGGYRPSDFHDTIWMSGVFETRVLIIYFDDEGSDMAIVANCGELERASINGMPVDIDDDEGNESFQIDVLNTFAINHQIVRRENWNDIYEREFKSVFGTDAPDLTDFDRLDFEQIDEVASVQKANSFPFIKIGLILAVLFLLFQLLPSYHASKGKALVPQKRTPPNLESLCGGDVSEKMEEVCDKMREIERETRESPE